jgi:hypothetical protein
MTKTHALRSCPARRVVQPAHVSEVDLRDVAGQRLDGDRNVARTHAARSLQPLAHPLDGPIRAVEVVVLQPQPVIDRSGLQSLAEQLLHARLEALHR